MSNINTIHTPCKNCVFAVYENNTQISCALDYIDKYKNKNIDILEAYDDEKEFYIINGKKCIGYRENKWFKQFDLQDATIDSKIAKYLETNSLDYFIVIDLKKINIDQLDDMLNQISLCAIQPKKVILVRYVDNELGFPYVTLERLFKKHNTNYVWRIQTILDLATSYENTLHTIISTNHKNRFILSVNNYSQDIKHLISHTNKVVHEDLDQFEILCNENHSCIIFSTLIYRFESFHGNNLLNNQDNYVIV